MRCLTFAILIGATACGESKTPAVPSPAPSVEPSEPARADTNAGEIEQDEPAPPAAKPLPPAKPELGSGRLWIPGLAGPDDEIPKAGANILALCGDELREGTVQVKAVRGDPGGHELRGPCDAFALFEAIEGLKTGPLTVARASPISIDETSIELAPGVVLRSERRGDSGYAVFLDEPGNRWVLADYPSTDGGIPELIWAGDLDSDPRLDLLIDVPPKYSVSLVRLYLSSAASEAPLAQVAERRHVVD